MDIIYYNYLKYKFQEFYIHFTKNHLYEKMKGVKALFLLGLITFAFAKEEKQKEDIGTVIGIDLGTTYSW